MVKAGDGSACSGAVQYGQQYGLFSGDQRLDIGTSALWDQASSATRLHLEAEAWYLYLETEYIVKINCNNFSIFYQAIN